MRLATASNLGRFDQKPNPPHALPLIRIQSECQFYPRGKRLGMAKPDAVNRLTLVFQFECQMLFTDQALRDDLDFFAKRRRGKTLAPDFFVQGVHHVCAAVLSV